MEREQTTIRLPTELKDKLQQEAERRGQSYNSMIIMILNEARNRHQTKQGHETVPTLQYAG